MSLSSVGPAQACIAGRVSSRAKISRIKHIIYMSKISHGGCWCSGCVCMLIVEIVENGNKLEENKNLGHM